MAENQLWPKLQYLLSKSLGIGWPHYDLRLLQVAIGSSLALKLYLQYSEDHHLPTLVTPWDLTSPNSPTAKTFLGAEFYQQQAEKPQAVG